MGDEQYRADIEADAWRFYRWWLDLDEDLLPELPAARLIEMLERLPLYEGCLNARAQAEMNSNNPNRGVVSPTGERREQLGSSGAELMSHPATADLIEYVRVPATA